MRAQTKSHGRPVAPVIMLGLLSAVLLGPAHGAPAAVKFTNKPGSCRVVTDHYQLQVDVEAEALVRLMNADGEKEVCRWRSMWVDENGTRYSSGEKSAHPHLHPLRSGPYLVELHIEKMRLGSRGEQWPGLGELSIFCHSDRVYVIAALIRPKSGWVNRGLYVYDVPGGYREPTSPLSASACGFELAVGGDGAVQQSDHGLVIDASTPFAARATSAASNMQHVPNPPALTFSRAIEAKSWEAGQARQLGGVLLFDERDRLEQALVEEANPLPAEAFDSEMGEFEGYDALCGVYRIRARTSGTPDPPRGLIAGARYTVQNSDQQRRILIDQHDPWGGITSGILRAGDGTPLPTVIQFGLNFPELHKQAGEPGWATLTYPLDLRASQKRSICAEHLYRALTDREIIYLTSLENIGNPLLLQTTVGRAESHTLTTGPYPRAHEPGNELRINDFRRIYSQQVVRSVSAILPTFFGYWDRAGEYHGLMPQFVRFRETGPFCIEYSVGAGTEDGAVEGTLRVWQAPHSDMTRVFTEVSLDVKRAIQLSEDRPAPLFFLRHHAFNPMAFRRFAFLDADGETHTGQLDYEHSIVLNGAPMADRPFACMYRASNAIDQDIPCSDITGNPGFVVLDWRVQFGEQAIKPGCYAFCTGAEDPEHGAYARDLAVVPARRITQIPAGSSIDYRAVQMVYGDNSSHYEVMERERRAWAERSLAAKADVGRVVSTDPIELEAEDGRIEAQISGGTDWIPVRVTGFRAGEQLHVRRTDDSGSRMRGPAKPDEPWYNAWPAEDGSCGYTFLVKMPDGESPVIIEVWQ